MAFDDDAVETVIERPNGALGASARWSNPKSRTVADLRNAAGSGHTEAPARRVERVHKVATHYIYVVPLLVQRV